MKVNVWKMIEEDSFFVGSYPDCFAIGRWFTAEEMANTTYTKIEQEYLEKYNPYHYRELELGVFDTDNYSGISSGEYEVAELTRNLHDIQAKKYYEIELKRSDSNRNIKVLKREAVKNLNLL